MRKKAYIIDAYSRGGYHEVINQGYLIMVASLYKEVVYVGELTACRNIMNLMDSCGIKCDNVVFREKRIIRFKIKFNRTLDRIVHLLHVSLLNYFYYMRATRGADVFFNNNLNFAIPLIQYFSFGKKNNIVDLCHNELERIDPHMVSHVVEKVLNLLYGFCFQKIDLSSKFKFLLLSEDMAEYFRSFVHPKNRLNIGWIDHCYIRPPVKFAEISPLQAKFKIGIPGYIAPGRGLSELKEFLSRFHRKDACVYAIGRIFEKIESPKLEELNKTKELMPFDLYNTYIQQMDVLMLCYTHGSYRLTASGAVLEAIWNEKPIFAIENKFFSYLFNKFGALGVLAKDAQSLANELIKINNEDLRKYTENLRNAKKMLSPDNVKEQLRMQLELW